MIRTYQRVDIDGQPVFVLSDDDAIDLAHQLAEGMNMSPVEAYEAIAAGDAAYQGHRLVIQD